MMDEHSWNFSVSEILPDGRVLVTTYVRIEQDVTCVMDVYDSMDLRDGKRYLDFHSQTGRALPTLEAAQSPADEGESGG